MIALINLKKEVKKKRTFKRFICTFKHFLEYWIHLDWIGKYDMVLFWFKLWSCETFELICPLLKFTESCYNATTWLSIFVSLGVRIARIRVLWSRFRRWCWNHGREEGKRNHGKRKQEEGKRGEGGRSCSIITLWSDFQKGEI